MTLSYVSVLDIKWFPLQSAMAASEHVLSFITCTYEGRTPPVKFLVQVWASTVHYFSEQVRITSLTAHDVTSNIGAWEHKWKWSGSQAASSSDGGRTNEPDNKELQNKISLISGQVKRMQSEKDSRKRNWNQQSAEDIEQGRRNKRQQPAAAQTHGGGKSRSGGTGKGGGRKGKY